MCVALDEITRLNVETLTQIKYIYGQKEYISDVIHCNTFKEFHEEYLKREENENVHSRCFLILHFELMQGNALIQNQESRKLTMEKIVFTQDSFEVVYEDVFQAYFFFCCSLAVNFSITERYAHYVNKIYPKLTVGFEVCYFAHANFTYLSNIFMLNSKVDILALYITNFDLFVFKENVVDNLYLTSGYGVEIENAIEISGSTFKAFSCVFDKKIEKLMFRNCKFFGGTEVYTKEEVKRLLFENCYCASTAILKLGKASVYDRFSLKLKTVPRQLELPDMPTSTEKILELPQSVSLNVSNFLPFERLEKKQAETIMSSSAFNGQKLEESSCILKNLERAYVLLQAASRQKESLEVLEGILTEKRNKKLLERAAEITKNFRSEPEEKIMQAAKYVELNYIKSLAYDWVVGYFINLKKILRTLLFVVGMFSAFFFFFPELLKVGVDEKGIDVTLQQLPMIDRIADCVYFTVVTLTTLGYGDIQPLGWGKLAASILALIGLLLSGMILAVILRRYSR